MKKNKAPETNTNDFGDNQNEQKKARNTPSLTSDQLEFLKKQNILKEDLFDAFGYSKKAYSLEMKTLGKTVAFNVTPCSASGHSLRTRSGHCIQCNTAYLGFQKRNDSPGFVYIAESKLGKIKKVGFANSISKREESLNYSEYAGFSDWKISFAIDSIHGGDIEVKIKSKIKTSSSENFNYIHENKIQKATELTTHPILVIKKILIGICMTNNYNYKIIIDSFITNPYSLN